MTHVMALLLLPFYLYLGYKTNAFMMDSEETKLMIRQLAYEWVKVELPTQRLTYPDYIRAIAGLNVITDDPARTTEIFTAVLDQAKESDHTSEWVETELKFEAQAEAVGNRTKGLRNEIATGQVSDDSLDLYNERIRRFGRQD